MRWDDPKSCLVCGGVYAECTCPKDRLPEGWHRLRVRFDTHEISQDGGEWRTIPLTNPLRAMS